jgi:hypothetical protein
MVNVDISPSVVLGVGLIGAGVSLWQIRRWACSVFGSLCLDDIFVTTSFEPHVSIFRVSVSYN